jgi:hypothetical protein
MRSAVHVDWDSLTWHDFVRGVSAYREYFSQQAREDAAYMRCYRLLQSDQSMLVRAGRSRQIVEFLNAWACRLKPEKAVPALRTWIRANAEPLEELALVTLADADVPPLAVLPEEVVSAADRGSVPE